MFDVSRIVVADGGKQFVRNVDVCDWSSIKNRDNIKLKYCLRQKNNIVKFINHFFEEYSEVTNKIISADKLPGGKVVIVSDKSKFFDVQKKEIGELKSHGNIAYDMLYLVPTTLVYKQDENRFLLLNEFEKNDIFVWDGTNEKVREQYTIQADEVRVIQYESARGLEAWTVCCMGFDTFITAKKHQFDGENNTLLLQSREESIKQYIENWIMISFTRAIDTMIICLDNAASEIGDLLKKMAEKYPDYIS